MPTEISSNPTEIVSIPNTNDMCSSSFNNSAEITTTQNRNVDDNDNAAKWVCGSKTRCSIRTLLNLFKGDGKSEKLIEQRAAATSSNNDVVDLIRKYIKNLKEASEALEVQFPDPTNQHSKLSLDGSKEKLRDLEKTVGELKLQISNYITNSASKDLKSEANAKDKDSMADLYKSSEFENSSLFKCFEVLYDDLEIELKLCLLCFSVFPENATIKRSLMIYWWIGEGFVRSPQGETHKTAEEMGIEFFEKLMAKGFIELFAKKKRLHVKECRMRPVVRWVVIKLAERAHFFDFDQGNHTPTARFSSSCRACLTGKDEELLKNKDLDALHSLFNFNLPYLDLQSKWFSKMKNVNLIFLGRWQSLDTDYTEVQDDKFLDGLKKNRYLRVLSLRGIFGIKNLPDSISGLVNLIVLDLRACYNLELVPNKIGLLKCLTHLDMSDCYLLEHMPKELSHLLQLQVLKGFVVGTKDPTNSCTLEELKKLEELRKLSIFIESKSVPTETEAKSGTGRTEAKSVSECYDFRGFEKLAKLTIEWEWNSPQVEVKPQNQNSFMKLKSKGKSSGTNMSHDTKKENSGTPPTPQLNSAIFPPRLEKLDLRGFPGTSAHEWLKPGDLENLKRLYFRGGKLCQFQDPDKKQGVGVRGVEVLRLKHLRKLAMGWGELRELFPELIYLEKVKCPKLPFFPCDATGVWMKR